MTLAFEADMSSIAQLVSATPSFSDGSGSPATSTIAATTLANRGPVWRMTGVGTGSNCVVWPIATALTFEDLLRDYLIEVEVAQGTYGAGGYMGVSIIDRVGTIHAYNHLAFGAAEWGSRIDNGTRTTLGTTGTGMGESGLARFWIRGRVQGGAPPLLKSHFEGKGNGEIRGSGATADNDTPSRPFSNNSLEGSSWNGLACASIGLCMQSSGGNALPTQVDVLSFRVFTNPFEGGDQTPPVITNIDPAP